MHDAPSSGRGRSRSPVERGHRCSVALAQQQGLEIQQTCLVRCDYFGDRKNMVPVKSSWMEAVQAWRDVPKINLSAQGENRDEECPGFVLTFFIPYETFHDWFDAGVMRKSPWKVGGYRIYQDIDLHEVDPFFKMHPVS